MTLSQKVKANIGKTIANVVMLKAWDSCDVSINDVGFRLEFTDGTSMEVSSQGSNEGTTWVTVDES